MHGSALVPPSVAVATIQGYANITQLLLSGEYAAKASDEEKIAQLMSGHMLTLLQSVLVVYFIAALLVQLPALWSAPTRYAVRRAPYISGITISLMDIVPRLFALADLDRADKESFRQQLQKALSLILHSYPGEFIIGFMLFSCLRLRVVDWSCWVFIAPYALLVGVASMALTAPELTQRTLSRSRLFSVPMGEEATIKESPASERTGTRQTRRKRARRQPKDSPWARLRALDVFQTCSLLLWVAQLATILQVVTQQSAQAERSIIRFYLPLAVILFRWQNGVARSGLPQQLMNLF